MLPIHGLVWYYLYAHVQACTHTLQTWKGTQGGTGHTLCSAEVLKGKPLGKKKKKIFTSFTRIGLAWKIMFILYSFVVCFSGILTDDNSKINLL